MSEGKRIYPSYIECMNFFVKKLRQFYKQSGRRLPWRKPGITAYEVWVSEIMLQQTQVSRVIDFYNRFLGRFPTIFDLARASWKQFLPHYRGLGYYRRGRNMLKTARMVVKQYGGVFPQDRTLLMQLPGIGEYSASAIMSFAYGKDYLAFDTNLKRVLGRFFYGSKDAKLNERFIKQQLRGNKHMLNSAIMDFANAVCTRTPHCDVCPLAPQCHYVKTSGKLEKITTTKRRAFPYQESRVFVWLHENHKKYFSFSKDKFSVFRLLPPINTREKIKEYFQNRYGLELSVRPPHKKIYIDKIPTLFVNAQILSGKPLFSVFSKEDAKKPLL